MKRGLYAVYDNKAEDIITPFVPLHKHEAVAVREFTELATMKDSRIAQHPEDYSLVRVGYLNDDNLTVEPNFAEIMTASQVLAIYAQSQEEPR